MAKWQLTCPHCGDPACRVQLPVDATVMFHLNPQTGEIESPTGVNVQDELSEGGWWYWECGGEVDSDEIVEMIPVQTPPLPQKLEVWTS